MPSAHAALTAHLVDRAGAEAYAGIAPLLDPFKRLPLPRKAADTAHARLEHKAAQARIARAAATLGAHLAKHMPPHWEMHGWGMRVSHRANTATWAGRAGAGQCGKGVDLALGPIARLAGTLSGLAWASQSQHTRPERARWDQICAQAGLDPHGPHDFMVHMPYSAPHKIAEARGRCPHDALLRHCAQVDACHTATPHPDPATAFAQGFAQAATLAALPVVWHGGRALWARAIQSRPARRLLSGTRARPEIYGAVGTWPLIRAFKKVPFPILPDARAHWSEALAQDTAHMAALAALGAQAGPPGPRGPWRVCWPGAPGGETVQAWDAPSAILAAALARLFPPPRPIQIALAHPGWEWPSPEEIEALERAKSTPFPGVEGWTAVPAPA